MQNEKELIEVTVKRHLEEKLQIPVYAEYPEKAPDQFVVVDKTNSSRENHLDSGMFVVQSYGTSKLEAAKLNERAKKAMDSLVELGRIAASDLNSDYPFPDTKYKKHRYQAVYDVIYY